MAQASPGVPSCPLCDGRDVAPFHADEARSFLRCGTCALVFLEPAQRLPLDAELARYQLHENHPDDAGYRAFLARLAGPVIERTSPGARGLDYGCGQSPVLGELLTAAGRPTVSYDPHFRPDAGALGHVYDFLTCSEVFEHVHDPAGLFERLGGLLRPGGLIGIMTGLLDDAGPFAEWWYRRDPTHVCFYSRATMEWVAQQRRWTVAFPVANVVLFHVQDL